MTLFGNSILSRFLNRYFLGERAFKVVLTSVSAVTGTILLLIIGFLIHEALPAMDEGRAHLFLGSEGWYPTEGKFGMLPMVVGSLAVAMGALLLSLPLAIGGAAFMRYFAPAIVQLVFRRLIEVVAGIPSVIFGLWGLLELVPIVRRIEAPGVSIFAAALVLSLMVLPTVLLIIDSAFSYFPTSLRRAAEALGVRDSTIVSRMVIPYSARGIVAAAVLGFGRAIGETMVVLMVAGNVVRMPQDVFDPVRTLTANIALEMAYAMGDHRASLFMSGLLLCLFVTVIALSIRTARTPAGVGR